MHTENSIFLKPGEAPSKHDLHIYGSVWYDHEDPDPLAHLKCGITLDVEDPSGDWYLSLDLSAEEELKLLEWLSLRHRIRMGVVERESCQGGGGYGGDCF